MDIVAREHCFTRCLESPVLITHTLARGMKWKVDALLRGCEDQPDGWADPWACV